MYCGFQHLHDTSARLGYDSVQALLARLAAGDSGTPPAGAGAGPTQDVSGTQREGSVGGGGGGPSPAARFGSGGFQPAPASSGFQPHTLASGFQQPAASAFQSPPATSSQLPQVLSSIFGILFCLAPRTYLKQCSSVSLTPLWSHGALQSHQAPYMVCTQAPIAHFPRVERPAVATQRSGSLGLSSGGGYGLPVTSGGSLWDSGAPGSGGRR
jgi:hypothetical protein